MAIWISTLFDRLLDWIMTYGDKREIFLPYELQAMPTTPEQHSRELPILWQPPQHFSIKRWWQVAQVFKAIEVVEGVNYQICCQKCSGIVQHPVRLFNGREKAALNFYILGYRKINEKILCPDCGERKDNDGTKTT